MQEHLITTQVELVDVCKVFARREYLAVDTEFVRTRTYYPKLGLIQICDGDQVALIDPLAVEDLTPVWQLIDDENIVKVIHACSEDIEIFIQQGKCQPKNVIDSQIMMSFLGHGLSVGYAAMVAHYLDIELDKSDSRTDWTQRPLSQSQLAYASADVIYLSKIIPTLFADLKATKWFDAATQDSQLLIAKKRKITDEESLFKAVKMSWRLNSKQLNNLKSLARWRYQQAQKRDLPLNFVAKDHTLIAVAQHAPKSVGGMFKIDGIDENDVRYKGKQLLAILKEADSVNEKYYPPKIKRLDQFPGYKQAFKKIKNFIAKIAEQESQPAENFASKKQINQFLSWYYKESSDVANIDI